MPLALELLDALEAFDQETAPLGLYACEEFLAKDRPFLRLHQEWELCLKPCLEQRGCRNAWGTIREGQFSFNLPDGARAEMAVVRTAKIKVRRYGSAYRIDKHPKYPERWDALRLDRALSDLWKPSNRERRDVGLRLCLFIGFAPEAEPFRRELSHLEEQVNWETHDTAFHTRWWPDRMERGFHVRLCAWSHPEQSEHGVVEIDGSVR